MTFAKAMLFLLCAPYAVQCIQVLSGADLTGTPKQKAMQLAEEICGRGVSIRDAEFMMCDDDQIGLFTHADPVLGMDFINGIVLSSGHAADVVPGNFHGSDVLHHLGYNALDNLIKPNDGLTKDACVLHITFDCQDDDNFGMDFVFGSKNYDCPTHTPALNDFEVVMGIFVRDDKNRAQLANIGLINNQYVSVNTFYDASASKALYIDNCPENIPIAMNGFSYPIHMTNEKGNLVTGKNEIWIAVADGYDKTKPVENNQDMKRASWLFVRRNSLVCIDTAARGSPGGNVRTGYRKCAKDALDGCKCGCRLGLPRQAHSDQVHPPRKYAGRSPQVQAERSQGDPRHLQLRARGRGVWHL